MRILFIFCLLVLSACQTEEAHSTTTKNPPTIEITVGDTKVPSKEGSYCWTYKRGFENSSRCVDMAGPIELLRGEKPTLVEGSIAIINTKSKPDSVSLEVREVNSDESVTTTLSDFTSFSLPKEAGEYYISLLFHWPQGDSSVHALIKVE